MNPERVELVKYRLQKARSTLADAQTLFSESSLVSTVNRIYYAMFYAVNALLLTKGLSSSKHAGVRGLFNKEFISTGLVDRDSGRLYNELFHNRQEGDYKDFIEFQKPQVESWLKLAEGFINLLEQASLKITAAG